MSGIVYYALDLETTGLMVEMHEICELSILRAVDKMQLTRMVKVEKPQHASYEALKITNKTIEDLSKGISKPEMIADVESFVNEDGLTPAHRCLVGHNIVAFDKKFLWKAWERENKRFPFDMYLDTLHMSKSYAKKNQLIKPKLNLGAACDLLGIKKTAGEHNAKSDTRNCFLLWEKLMVSVDYLELIKRLPHADEEENDQKY